jgi:hypothetical protein
MTYSALASETIGYSYDASGRLIKVARSGTVNNGVSACYAHDKADNRSNVTVATTNCEPASPTFAISDASGIEAAGSSITFVVSKKGTASTGLSINFATASSSATSPSDFTAASGMLTFAVNETSKTVTVTLADGSVSESYETFFVNLSGATGGATIADAQGVGSIVDNE